MIYGFLTQTTAISSIFFYLLFQQNKLNKIIEICSKKYLRGGTYFLISSVRHVFLIISHIFNVPKKDQQKLITQVTKYK